MISTTKILIDNLYHKIPYLQKEDIAESVNHIINYLSEELRNNNRIEIRGFGSFSVKKRKYATSTSTYNTVYYRMAKSITQDLNLHKIDNTIK